MITKEQIKDWLEVEKRKETINQVEDYIDSKLKENLMEGITTISISTVEFVDSYHSHVDNKFSDLWENPELSEDSQNYVKSKIVNKYKDNGFDVSIKTKDKINSGNSTYEYIEFKDIHKMIE